MSQRNKICLLGLDGLNRELFDFLAARNLVPALSRLAAEGAGGVLKSTRPPYTGPAWVSLMTGVNPGKHGIFGFTRRSGPEGREEFLTSDAVRLPRLWDWLSGAGFKVGVFNVPFTYPASGVNGFMVAGMLTPSLESDFARPRYLAEEIRSRRPRYLFDVAVDPERDGHRPEVFRDLIRSTRERIELLNELLDRYDPDFLAAVFTAPDRVQHLWGKALRPGGEGLPGWADGPLEELFVLLDSQVARLREWTGTDGLVLAASDHGFAGMEGTFYLNNWLAREGFLRLKPAAGGFPGLIGRLNRPALKRRLPRRLVCRLRSRGTADLVDWSGTSAFASPGMEEGIYLRRGDRPAVAEAELLRRREEIRRGLLELEIPRFRDVLPREEVYSGPCLPLAPDLLLDFAEPGWNMSGSLTGREIFRSCRGRPYGTHHPDGFWAAAGPGVAPGRRPASILDVAPTVLAAAGIDLPAGVEGESLLAAGPERSAPVSPEPREVSPGGYTAGEEARLRERLAGLGYL